MGHRLSKTPPDSRHAHVHAHHRGPPPAELETPDTAESETRTTSAAHRSPPHPLGGPVINVQIQDTPTAEPPSASVATAPTTSAAANANACPRQIIIKIQLAKMEPGHEGQDHVLTSTADHGAVVATANNNNNNATNSISNSNNNNNGTQFVNLTFNRSLTCGEVASTASEENSSNNNNNFGQNVVVAPGGTTDNFHVLMGSMAELQLDEKRMSVASSSSSSSGADLATGGATSDAAEETPALRRTESPSALGADSVEHCCRRKSKSSPFPARWRCCKCTCRDAFKRIMDASSSKGGRRKERKEAARPSEPQWAPLPTPLVSATPTTATATATATPAPSGPHMSIWAPSSSDVIIPISSPQFVVVQCPPSSLVTVGRIDDNAIRLMATELVASGGPRILSPTPALAPTPAPMEAAPTPTPTATSSSSTSASATPHSACPAGPVVHSQVDYIHCLVPDLEKITKASFYWGKMDRYEAERLLEGKPEGTFLLRDSAQEEYLFSVTFRKYGRSLHARIEQSNHKFSFDCHDPCVFTASTVTGLLEHYKDPACVMFFEPMLTIPLHRSTTFSLQQLCRATIVSHTSYDGVNELELPSRLKAYLKEYHYKQKLRVKPFDEPFYSCT